MWNWWSSKRLHGGRVRLLTLPLANLSGRSGSGRGAGGCTSRSLRLACVLLVALVPPALATTVYRSVGSDGEMLFSDQPPASGKQVDVLQVSTSQASADADTRLRQLRLSTDRMAKSRREREAERAEAAGPTIRYTTNRDFPVREVEAAVQPEIMLWPNPYRRGILLGPLRHPQNRPVPPAPVPPGYKRLKPGNQQLMRPVVSSRD